MIQTLARHGLREVRTDGRFDPFEHEALMRQETDEEEDGTILEVFHKGYLLGPKVIRTAKVKVAKAKETDHGRDAQDDEESQGSSREVNEE
jgi:molecular chaperone GrpE